MSKAAVSRGMAHAMDSVGWGEGSDAGVVGDLLGSDGRRRWGNHELLLIDRMIVWGAGVCSNAGGNRHIMKEEWSDERHAHRCPYLAA